MAEDENRDRTEEGQEQSAPAPTEGQQPESLPEPPEEPGEVQERQRREEAAEAVEEAPQDEQTEGVEAAVEEGSAEQEEAEPAEGEGPVDEGLVPPEVAGVRVPLLGTLPMWAVVAALGLSAGVLILVFLAALSFWYPAGPVPVAEEARAAALAALLEAEESKLRQEIARMDYGELIDSGQECSAAGDHLRASRLYEEAAGRKAPDERAALFARCKLASALACTDDTERALMLCESLRSVSRPGDELWKHALIQSIGILARKEQWGEFFRQVCLLRANSARYSDEAAVNRWLAYCRAMARARMAMRRCEREGPLYGAEPPALGRAACKCRPLMTEDIAVGTATYDQGVLQVDYAGGELTLTVEAVPLDRVLAAVAEQTGLEFQTQDLPSYRVTASLVAGVPEHAIEMVLGSVGLEATEEGPGLAVHPLDPEKWTDQRAIDCALWSLQEFLMLYPESANVPEAYYALARLYVAQGQADTALRQLKILDNEFSGTIWNLHGRYLAGRVCAEAGDWARAERELLGVVDSPLAHGQKRAAFYWLAESQKALQKYGDAAACYRRALDREGKDPRTAHILYNIAYCTEKDGAPLAQCEERYMEVRTRYPRSEYAPLADFRLARMALEAGDHRKAAMRYEFYLGNWPVDDQAGRDACRDLMLCYVQNGQYAHAVLLGEVMWSTFADAPQCAEVLPALLNACRSVDLSEMGLSFLDLHLEGVQDPALRQALQLERAGLLADVDRSEAADALLHQLESEVSDPLLRNKLRLQKARSLLAASRFSEAIELCRQVALECSDQSVCAEALELLGRHYESEKRFDMAALVYSGQCPAPEEGTTE